MRNYINLHLADRQGLDEETIAKLNELHEEMEDLKHEWGDRAIPDFLDQKAMLMEVEALEFEMQDLWGFNRDAARHTHRSFFKLPDDRK